MRPSTEWKKLESDVSQLRSIVTAAESGYGGDSVELFRMVYGHDPYEWEKVILNEKERHVLVNCCRQAGKSTTVGVRLSHEAVQHDYSECVVIADSQTKSKELLRKSKRSAYHAGSQADNDSMTTFGLANGSRILALPGTESSVRGFTAPRILCVDEAGWVPDEVFWAAWPLLSASDGQLVACTTPNGQRGWFHDLWIEGGDEYIRLEVPWQDCPHISRSVVEQARRQMPLSRFEAEYECVFGDAVDSVFRTEDLLKAACPELTELFPEESARLWA